MASQVMGEGSYLVRRCHVGPQNDTPRILNVSLDVQGLGAHDLTPFWEKTCICIYYQQKRLHVFFPSHSSERWQLHQMMLPIFLIIQIDTQSDILIHWQWRFKLLPV